MRYQLETEYQGAKLQLQFESHPEACLNINGIRRDKVEALCSNPDSADAPAPQSGQTSVILKLNSVVQTDYEWHEFIEASLDYQPSKIEAAIFASNELLKSTTIDRQAL